jgi:2-haloacid dehalogenase
MTLRRRPEVVAFDVNETMLDLAPVHAALMEAGQPETLLPAFDASLARVSDLRADERHAVAEAFGAPALSGA